MRLSYSPLPVLSSVLDTFGAACYNGLTLAMERRSMTKIARITYTHDAMIDLILQDPTVTHEELAELFALSRGWVSRVVYSDAFQARIAERKAQLIDPFIAADLNTRLRGVTIQAVNIMSAKLEAEESADYALEALGLAGKAMGRM